MRLLHWLYIMILLTPAVIRLVQKVSTDTGGFASRYGPLIVALILVAGFVGYILNKPLLTRRLWRFCFWLFTVVAFGLLIFAINLAGSAVWFEAILILVGAIAATPALVSMHKYSSPNHSVWDRPNTN